MTGDAWRPYGIYILLAGRPISGLFWRLNCPNIFYIVQQ
jgi:hypothetical protein